MLDNQPLKTGEHKLEHAYVRTKSFNGKSSMQNEGLRKTAQRNRRKILWHEAV